MKRIFFALALAIAVLAAVLLVRTARFSSRQLRVPPAPSLRLDVHAAARRLSRAIQFKTDAEPPASRDATDPLIDLREFLFRAFPLAHAHLRREVINGYSLLYTWQGTNPTLPPMLLAGHLDVVPAAFHGDRQWSQPPFAGRITDGYLWGRGAMDDKVGVLGILEAVEYLLAGGFQPVRTVYLAFGHDEESGGNEGAAKIAALLRERKVRLEFVLDEGGNVADKIIPGMNRPVALVGIAEKGYLDIVLETRSPGGHSSMPPAETAIGILASALYKLALSPPAPHLTAPTKRMFEFIGPEMAWHQRVILANLWLFAKFLRGDLDQDIATRALIRTTLAPTLFQSGVRENVLPTEAKAVINVRLLPGDTIAAVTDHVRKTIADPRVRIIPTPQGAEASPVSDIEAGGFKMIQRTVHETFPDAVVAPFLLVAGTDSRHYADLTKNIYRFLPISLGPGDLSRYHGTDERVSLRDYDRCIGFYLRLIRHGSEG